MADSKNKKEKKNTKTKKMKIITPTAKMKEAMECHNSEDAYQIFIKILKYEYYELKSQEHFWVMGIDDMGVVACIYIATMGAIDKELIDPIDVFSTAINHKSKRIIIAHNLPNVYKKDLIFDVKDLNFTNRLYHASLPFGIKVIDNITILEDGYDAYGENDNMELIHNSPTYKPYNQIKPKLDKEKEEAVDNALVEGFTEGEAKGIDKGKLEEKIEMAKSMLKDGTDINFISKHTGLTVKEINALRRTE